MKSLRLTCVLAMLASVFVMAQSNRSRSVDHAKSQPSEIGTSPNSSSRREFSPSEGTFGAKESGRRPSPMQGLSFAPVVTYGSGGYAAWSVAVADVNSDGKPDLLVANCGSTGNCNNGAVGVLLGNGDGTFQTAMAYGSGGSHATSLAVADVNGDGKPDIVVTNADDNTVSVLLGNGDGTFQTAVAYGSGGDAVWSVSVADVNSDGKPDLLVTNGCLSDGCGDTVSVLLGNGDGTFQTAVAYGSGGGTADSVAVADVNGDGKPDLLVANCGSSMGDCSDGTVGVLLGNGDGTFQTAVAYSSGGENAYSIAVADVNGDGKPDILVANAGGNGNVGVLLGNGDGTFQTAMTYDSGGVSTSVAMADVNGDGIPDLVVASCGNNNCENGNVGVLLGNGDGTFQTVVFYGSGGFEAYSVAVADINGDGKPDVVVANMCASGGTCANGGVIGVLVNTSLIPTTTTLISSLNPSNFGQAVTFSATVTPRQGVGSPTGTVDFFDGGTNIGNSNLNSSGVATLATSTLSVGTHTITATYNGDANFAPSTSPPLYQVVQGAIAVISPTGLNFGNQTVGIPSTPQNVTLTNTGNINLLISMIQITGANTNDFSQRNNCPASLAPNSSCKIAVTFTPRATGTRNAAVSVSDNAPNSPQSASLTGVGVLPAVMFSPTSLTFKTQVVYTTSAPQKLTLTNTGLGILEIKGAKISAQFRVTTTCGKTLDPGNSCTAEVRFKPTTKGQIGGSITLTDNAPDSPQQVPLSGTGTFVSLSPTSLNFGNQPVNTTSPPKYITLENKGTGPVNFTGSGITITGADPGDFAQQNNCPNSLPSGSFCKIKVTFTPTQQGKRTADVSVSDDGGGSPQTVPLTGTGTP